LAKSAGLVVFLAYPLWFGVWPSPDLSIDAMVFGFFGFFEFVPEMAK
jgi:hypothetical protein